MFISYRSYIDTLKSQKYIETQMTPELKKRYAECHTAAIKHFEDIGELPKDRKPHEYILHHIDPTMKWFDLQRYSEWRPEDLRVLSVSEHSKLHCDFMKREREYGFLTDLFMQRLDAIDAMITTET